MVAESYNELVDKVFKDCSDNLKFVEKRLLFMKSMKRQHRKLLMNNGLTYDEIVKAWEEGVGRYKERG